MSRWMSLALSIAAKGKYSTHPNPHVGCIVVKDGKVIASAYHQQAGEAHAEVIALQQAGPNAKGADIYITLEPCSHTGKTPPCVNAIIQSGIARAFIAITDPNPKVNGQGIAFLKAAGIEVHVGILQEDAYQLNKTFFHYIHSHRPFVTAKWAMTLDGKIATKQGKSQWISSEDSRRSAHYLRAKSSAVLVGRRTVITDNPRLNVRYLPADSTYACLEEVRQPRPIILTTTGHIPLSSHLLHPGAQTLVLTSNKANLTWLRELERRGIEFEFLAQSTPYQLDLHNALECLGKREIIHLLVEGGSQTLGQFWENKLINSIAVYISPKIMGTAGISPIETVFDMPANLNNYLSTHMTSTIGKDVLVTGDLEDNFYNERRHTCSVE